MSRYSALQEMDPNNGILVFGVVRLIDAPLCLFMYKKYGSVTDKQDDSCALKVNLDLFLVFVVGECVAFCLYIKHHNTYMHIIAGQKLQPGNCLSLRRQVKLFGCRHY